MLSTDARPANDFLAGFLVMLPLIIGVVPFALLVGALAIQKISHLELLIMSATVYAGAAQFIALDMWSSPVQGLTIIAVTAMVNLRYLMISASLRPKILHLPVFIRWGFTSVVSDETWAMAMRESLRRPLSSSMVLGLVLPFYLVWLLATQLGAWSGRLIEDPSLYGLGFAYTAVFIVFLSGFWTGKAVLLPSLVSLCTALLAEVYLGGAWYILIGGLSGSLAAVFGYWLKTGRRGSK